MACLLIDILYIFIKYLFSEETELPVGEEKEGEEENRCRGTSEALASHLREPLLVFEFVLTES